jgi:hypothetical protein
MLSRMANVETSGNSAWRSFLIDGMADKSRLRGMQMTTGPLHPLRQTGRTPGPVHGLISMNSFPPRLMNLVRPIAGFVLIGCVLLGSALARAAEPEDVYLPIFNLIQQGDFLKNQGHPDQALPKYEKALDDLRHFQVNYPTFNQRMIAYRSNDVAMKIAALNGEAPGEDRAASGSGAGASVSGPGGGGTPSRATVKLLQPGAEPRKALRLHPKQGDKKSVVMTMKMSMAMNMGGQEMPMKIPAMNMTMDTTVDAVKPDGDIQYTTVISDISVAEEAEANSAVADAMKNALGGLKGLTSTGVLSSRGFSKKLDMKPPEGADPQVSTLMEQMKETLAHLSAPLPEQPIGAGAKWEVKMPLKSQGMTINQTAGLELISLEGDKLTTRNTVTQTAPAQKIQNPAMPGIKIDLLKMTGRGSGESTIDLNQILPVAGTGDFHSEMSMGMNQGGQKQTMDMKVDLNLKIESK